MNTLQHNLQAIQTRISAAKQQAKRGDEITLIAVSKAQSAEKVRAAFECGQVFFGENYCQEALQKQQTLQDCAIEWHFIGPIQSNKTALIAPNFSWVHSVDRIKIAERLAAARGDLPPLNVCIQINSSLEASKSGTSTAEIIDLAKKIVALPQLKLRGLMAIPAATQEIQLQHQQFRQVKMLFDDLRKQGFAMDTLSIGMSGDFEVAILEGATMVRVGSAIFGARTS